MLTERARTDVYEAPEHLPGDPLLRQALLACDELLRPAFDEADSAALAHQDRHRRIVRVAAGLGTLAVLFAIFGTAVSTGPFARVALVVDCIMSVVALSAIGLGLFAQVRRRWYLKRHVAERLCLLKYQALIQACREVPGPDTPAFGEWKRSLAADVQRIRHSTDGDMSAWAEMFPAPVHLGASSTVDGNAATITAFRAYFSKENGRLRAQEAYFRRRAEQYRTADARLRGGVPGLFLFSVFVSLLYFAYMLLWRPFLHGHFDDGVARTLTAVSAASLSVVGMFRILRGADEYARNTVRFSALYKAVQPLGRELQKESSAHAMLQTITDIEALFEEEHREWLRLMIEAEWYG